MKRKLLSLLVLLAAVVTGAWAETIDLATLSTASFITLNDGDVLTGTLDGTTQKCCLIIADGATVTLDNAIINGVTDDAPEAAKSTVNWAGLNCIGDATIILKEGTTNSVRGFYHRCPGIFVPEDKTLTIEGPGTLNATGSISTEANHVDKSSNPITCSPGIGSAVQVPAGNIVINGGTINAQGGWASAAIGGNFTTACGNITITGGTVNATGSMSAAAIGGGWFSTSGDIEISGGTVTAISGPAVNGTDGGPGIGCGSICNGGNITISGSATVTATGGDYAAGIGTGGTLNGIVSSCGDITIGGSTNVTTTGGVGAAGIGCGGAGICGNITIGDNVIIKATKGDSAPYSVGAGSKVSDTSSTCGTITIGGVVISGNVSESPFNYPVYLTAREADGAYWTTFYSNAANYNYQAPEGSQVFKVNLSGTSLTMTEITDRIVKSGEGVVLKSTSGSIALTPTIAASSDDYTGNSLQGTATEITNPGNAYVLNKGTQGVGFYKLSASGTIGAGKAYLVAAASARDFFGFDGETTGISEIERMRDGENEKFFDLQGRKVAQPTKGLYIVNGKKVVIK